MFLFAIYKIISTKLCPNALMILQRLQIWLMHLSLNAKKYDLAMLILIKSKRCQVDIGTWNTRHPVEHTQNNFKNSYRIAYDSLCELGNLTLDQSPMLNQAQLMESILHAMQFVAAETDGSAPDTAENPPPPPEQQQQEQHAGNTFKNTLLKKIKELKAELSELKRGIGKRTSRSSHGRSLKRYNDHAAEVLTGVRIVMTKRMGIKVYNISAQEGGQQQEFPPKYMTSVIII